MTQQFSSTESVEAKEWLIEKVYTPKKKRSLELAEAAVRTLKERNQKVTIQSIHEVSKEIDPKGNGLHRNTITGNPDVYAVYTENRTYSKNVQVNARTTQSSLPRYEQFLKRLKRDRDLALVRNRYKRLTKQELINRLIQCEQYVAESRHQWLLEQFQSEM
ncbi:hypothetical protein [Brevibacillus brevis]|uniref:hypothetical protein n=1 Tax=Brevibacillus brevis TaxID=1393 RepID=UPI0037C582A9